MKKLTISGMSFILAVLSIAGTLTLAPLLIVTVINLLFGAAIPYSFTSWLGCVGILVMGWLVTRIEN